MLDRGPLSGPPRGFGVAGALLLTVWLVAGAAVEAHRLGGGLSPVADPFSESNAIRGARAYLAEGWTSHAGLPETSFGGSYPETGDFHRYKGAFHVDTHYPPGAMWATAAMMTVCGTHALPCVRSLPIAVSALGALALALASLAVLGTVRGLAAMLALFTIPLYSNMMVGLHYQGYALGLLSLQLAVLLRCFAAARPLAARELALVAGLGFLQGWLSFDYFFLVALVPVPVALLFVDVREREARGRVLALVAAGAGGFALAHALHFLQVVGYYGDLAAAVRDLAGVARERADPQLSSLEPPPAWASNPWMMSSIYLFVLSPRDTYFGFSLGYALLAALGALALMRGRSLRLPGSALSLRGDASERPVWAILAGVAVSCAWISAMPGHAHTHPHFIPRHLFLAWLVMVFALLRSLALERRGAPA